MCYQELVSHNGSRHLRRGGRGQKVDVLPSEDDLVDLLDEHRPESRVVMVQIQPEQRCRVVVGDDLKMIVEVNAGQEIKST